MLNVGNGVNFNVVEYSLDTYCKGQFGKLTSFEVSTGWNVFFFYPADFTFVCPTELADLQEHYDELRSLGVNVYGVSTDTHFVHKAWADASDTIKSIQYPLIGDSAHILSQVFGVLDYQTGLAQRSTFVVNPEGRVVISEQTDDGIGRNAAELVRKVKAAIYTREHPGEACPAKWAEGAATLTPSIDLIGKI
jgi:peroxiredoxin (alkyl hydroperoxide reductase subunit C)